MSAATVHTAAQTDPVDKTINRTIRALLVILDMEPETFWIRANITKGTYYNRMRLQHGWSAAEVKRAADTLGVSVVTLYEGLELPHLDSNQKPADYQMGYALVA